MKKNSFFFIFLILFTCFSSYSNEAAQELSGYEMCRELFAFLSEQNAVPIETPLLSADGNNFPFNITVEFKADEAQNRTELYKQQDFRTDFIISFTVEEALRHKEYISAITKAISEVHKKCTVRIAFTYGDYSRLQIPDKITGTEVLLESVMNKNRTSALCIKFTKGKNAIIPGGDGNTTPSWLTELAANAFYSQGIFYELKGGIISSLYRITFLQNDEKTSRFLKAEIPAAGIELNPEKISADETASFLSEIVSSYNPADTTEWDSHTNQIVIGNKIIWIREKITTILFLAVTFASLLALSELSFLRKRSRNNITKDVMHLWYLIPLTVLATTLSFIIGQELSSLLYKWFFIDSFTKIAVKLFSGFLLTSLYFLLIIRVQGILVSNAYAYFVTLSGIINIFLFSCIDISLFYLFTAEYIIIYLSRPVKKTYILAFFFLLLLVPLMPYSVQLIKYISPSALPRLINSSFFMNMIIAFGFLPFEFIWLRILTRLNKKWTESDADTKRFIKQNIAAVASAVGIFAVILITVSLLIPEKYKTVKKSSETVFIRKGTEDLLDVSFTDYRFFGETARIIFIETAEQCESCTVSIKGENSQPVLYSDNLYISDTKTNTDSFRLTVFPPKKMQFSYIADNTTDSTITVSALIPYQTEEETLTFSYKLYKKDIFIPGRTENGGAL